MQSWISPASSAPVSPAPTLRAVLEPLPAIGVQRLIAIVRELAIEIDLARALGLGIGPLTEDSVRIESAGTPLERARLTLAISDESSSVESGVRALGVMLGRIIGQKPLALDGSIWTPPHSRRVVVMRRRADADVVESLSRTLSALAKRCAGRDPRYQETSQLAADLARLSAVAERIVEKRRAAPPVVAVAYPRPRLHQPVQELPKVIVDAA